jgi:predicted nuclease of restriction endonuclease-like (RecB) superfamily
MKTNLPSKLPIIDDRFDSKRINQLYHKVSSHIEQARSTIRRSIDVEMIKAYWLIGQEIIEEEQHGQDRADYGKAILKGLSVKLQEKYHRGFSVDILEKARRFFILYPHGWNILNSATTSRKSTVASLAPNLSWSHYVELIRVSREDARKFYALEASKNNWNVRELRRQISSFLYDQVIKSKDKEAILKLACEGQEINTPEDALKEPLVLEFIGAPEPNKLSESQLEAALISNLQQFLLELGKGFAFIGRQKRLTFDNDHYYADLVFYHVILKCYVIIDLKTHKLTHADLGQMQLYVNYFDLEIKTESDNPTIGLVLCTEKSDAMVKYLLGEKTKQIFASTYQFHLPTEAELEAELKREMQLIKQQLEENESE